MSAKKFMVIGIVALYGLVLISHAGSTGTMFNRIGEAAEIYTSSGLSKLADAAQQYENDGENNPDSDSSGGCSGCEGFTAGSPDGCLCPALEEYIIEGWYPQGGSTEFIKEEDIPSGLPRGTIHCDTWWSVCSRHYTCPILYPELCKWEAPRRFTNADGDCCLFIWGTWRQMWRYGLVYFDENYNPITGPVASTPHYWTKVDYVVCPTFSVDIQIAGTADEDDDVVCVGGTQTTKACLSGPSEATQEVTFSVDPSSRATVSPTSITMTVGTDYNLTITGAAASSSANDTSVVAKIGTQKAGEEDFTVVDVTFDRDPVVVGVSKTKTVTAMITPPDFYEHVSFSTRESAIADVSPTMAAGSSQELTVSGIRKGTTTLDAKLNGETCTSTAVRVGPLSFVRVTPDPGILFPGDRVEFTAVGFAKVDGWPMLPADYSPDLSTPVGTEITVENTKGIFLGPVPSGWKLEGEPNAEAFIPDGVPAENVKSVIVEAAAHTEGDIVPDLYAMISTGDADKADLKTGTTVQVILSFDDGPVGDNAIGSGSNWTEEIMKDLKANRIQNDIKACFFVLTHMKDRGDPILDPDPAKWTTGQKILKREFAEDHVVAFHGGGKGDHESHKVRVKARPYDADEDGDIDEDDGQNGLESDIIAAKIRLKKISGDLNYDPEFVRPPEWKRNNAVLATYERQGLKMILRDLWGKDTGLREAEWWWPMSKSIEPEDVRERLEEHTEGAIKKGHKVLVAVLHDWNDATARNLADPEPSYLGAIVAGAKKANAIVHFETSAAGIREKLRAKEEWYFVDQARCYVPHYLTPPVSDNLARRA